MIFKKLPLEDLSRAMRTCKHFHAIIQSSKKILEGLHWFTARPMFV